MTDIMSLITIDIFNSIAVFNDIFLDFNFKLHPCILILYNECGLNRKTVLQRKIRTTFYKIRH